MEEHEARERLVRGLLNVLDAHAVAERKRAAAPVPDAGKARSSRRRAVLTRPAAWEDSAKSFVAVLEEELPNWRELVTAGAADYPLGAQRLAGPWSLPRLLLKVLKQEAPAAEAEAAVRRIVGFFAGPALAPWEYASVDIASQSAPIDLFDGWQLASCTDRRDEHLPIQAFDAGYALNQCDPDAVHGDAWHAALRRQTATPRPTVAAPGGAAVLLWPVLFLNVTLPYRVLARITYQIEPGRWFVEHTREVDDRWPYPWSIAPEAMAWSDDPQGNWPRRARVLDPQHADRLAQAAGPFGRCLASLPPAALETVRRAGNELLHLRHVAASRVGAHAPADPHPGRTALSWALSIESLLAPGNHGEISRTLAQRTAFLIGRDDEERSQIGELVKAAYASRSEFAHGSKVKQRDLVAIEGIVVRTITAWIVATALHGKDLPEVLDAAIYQRSVLEHQLRAPLGAFEAEGGALQPLPPIPQEPGLPRLSKWPPPAGSAHSTHTSRT